MAPFQEIKATSDQRPAADRAGHGNCMDHLKNALNSGAIDLPEGARAPKARKPYTISKQREKWTEDEHKLFLEALQQHGRAWRRIQEHIGSKTAVQIRSHAQKFFSKVIRESFGDSNSIAAPPQIQIPPPRPKRKPSHPYPRKLGNSLRKDASAIKQLEKLQLKVQSLSEQENCSPKSVLTTAQIGSQILALEGSGSPASSVYMEEKCLTPSTSVEELGVQVALSKDATTSDGAACGMREGPVLRLFGKRVVVNNLHEQPISNTANLQHVADMELDSSAETPTSGTGKVPSHGAEEAKKWSPWLTGTQQFMYYLPQGEVLSFHSACQFLNYGNGSISYRVSSPQTVTSDKQQHQPSQPADCKFTRAEGLWTESMTTSNSVPGSSPKREGNRMTHLLAPGHDSSKPGPSFCNLDKDYSAIQELAVHSFDGAPGLLLVGVRHERETSRPLGSSIHHELNFREIPKFLERIPEALFGRTERETVDVQPGSGAMGSAQRLEAGSGGGLTMLVAVTTGGSGRTKRARGGDRGSEAEGSGRNDGGGEGGVSARHCRFV